MKTLRKVFCLGMLALTSMSLVAPSNARAILLVSPETYGQLYIENGLAQLVVECILVAPFCLLDQKVDAAPSMSKQDLIDNGVIAPGKADQYIRESQELVQALAQQHKKLIVGETDTNESLGIQLHSIDPKLTDDFVKFYVGQALLTAKK